MTQIVVMIRHHRWHQCHSMLPMLPPDGIVAEKTDAIVEDIQFLGKCVAGEHVDAGASWSGVWRHPDHAMTVQGGLRWDGCHRIPAVSFATPSDTCTLALCKDLPGIALQAIWQLWRPPP